MAEADPGIFDSLPAVREIELADAAALDAALRDYPKPFVVRGLASQWPLVEAGRRSGREAREYILRHHRDRAFTVSIGDPRHGGRMFYDETMAMNFRTGKAKLPEVFGQIDRTEGDPDAPALYLSSIDLGEYFDGLHEANHAELGARECLASIWMGTATRIAAHNDFPHNLACCVVGRRRFTLFPPEQFANLYLGPIDNTPAGRAVSMVDFAAPDFDAHPRFAEALRHAQVAELDAGDAVYIPSLWWHHVEGLSPFNALVNYWWRDTPRYLGQPQDALNHAIMAVRDLPAEEREVWRRLFDYYVFDNGPEVTAHIPEGARGVLDPLDAAAAGRLRAFLLRALSQ